MQRVQLRSPSASLSESEGRGSPVTRTCSRLKHTATATDAVYMYKTMRTQADHFTTVTTPFLQLQKGKASEIVCLVEPYADALETVY